MQHWTERDEISTGEEAQKFGLRREALKSKFHPCVYPYLRADWSRLNISARPATPRMAVTK